MADRERGRQQAFGNQGLPAVDIAQHFIEQGGALDDAALDRGPIVGRDDERQQIERPRPRRPVGIGINVVGDAVFADLARDLVRMTVEVGEARTEQIEECAPGRGHFPRAIGGATQFVVMPGPCRQCEVIRDHRSIGLIWELKKRAQR